MASYRGQERRQHHLYVTRNTEYHVRGRTCVGVRDLWTGRWSRNHPALGRKLFGAVAPAANGLEPVSDVRPGSLLWFENGDDDILTSVLTFVSRPPRSALVHYKRA
jgi:hypothetical protein